jgi:DNA-binding SARP family transcriptional activator
MEGLDVDLSPARPSARTLLRALAVHAGGSLHREALVELFWPGRSAEAGMHNLHVAVSSLRRCLDSGSPGLGRALLARSGDAYVLAPHGRLVTDIQRLESAVQDAAVARASGNAERRAQALRSALALYTGDVLPEDGPAEWVVEVRERVRQRVARAASDLASVELDREDLPAAVAAARRSIELDPWNDESWRLLIEAHRRAGDHALAAVALRAYRRRLHDLGVDAVASTVGTASDSRPLEQLHLTEGDVSRPVRAVRAEDGEPHGDDVVDADVEVLNPGAVLQLEGSGLDPVIGSRQGEKNPAEPRGPADGLAGLGGGAVEDLDVGEPHGTREVERDELALGGTGRPG